MGASRALYAPYPQQTRACAGLSRAWTAGLLQTAVEFGRRVELSSDRQHQQLRRRAAAAAAAAAVPSAAVPPAAAAAAAVPPPPVCNLAEAGASLMTLICPPSPTHAV